MSRILAISDIHGHSEGVRLLLRKAAYNPQADQLFLLGDYIDKDPATWGALSYIDQLVREGARAIMGNLEQWLAAQVSKKETACLTRADFQLIEQLPLYIEHDAFLFVHAGIRPGISLQAQQKPDLLSIRQEFWESRERFPQIVVFGHTPTHRIGAEAGEVWNCPDRIGIDTGAKHGLRLSLVDLTHQCSYSCSTNEASLYQDVRVTDWRKRGGTVS